MSFDQQSNQNSLMAYPQHDVCSAQPRYLPGFTGQFGSHSFNQNPQSPYTMGGHYSSQKNDSCTGSSANQMGHTMDVMVKQFLAEHEPEVRKAVQSNLTGCPFINFVRNHNILSDLIEGTDSFVLQVEIPGGKQKDDIEVTMENQLLTVKAKSSKAVDNGSAHTCPSSCKCDFALGKSTTCSCTPCCSGSATKSSDAAAAGDTKCDDAKGGLVWRLKERPDSANFRRSWRIPDNIDETKTSVSFENGVLTVNFPKLNSPVNVFKKIEIN